MLSATTFTYKAVPASFAGVLGLMRAYLHVILNMVTRKSFSPHIALWSWYKRNMAFCSDIMIIHSTKHSFTDLALIRK